MVDLVVWGSKNLRASSCRPPPPPRIAARRRCSRADGISLDVYWKRRSIGRGAQPACTASSAFSSAALVKGRASAHVAGRTRLLVANVAVNAAFAPREEHLEGQFRMRCVGTVPEFRAERPDVETSDRHEHLDRLGGQLQGTTACARLSPIVQVVEERGGC